MKTENPSKRIAFLENEHSKSFAKWLRKEVERELGISKESVSEIIRWISYGQRATGVKYDAYNINGYTFRMKCQDGKVYQNNEVERELGISKESVSEIIRWISYGQRATGVKYDAYNINGYTFRMKCQDGKVYQNNEVSVEAIDLHISKEVATTRQAFYYGVLQEIWGINENICSMDYTTYKAEIKTVDVHESYKDVVIVL
nr:hypothetical protein [Tanacetum cinerariifolium]